MKFYIVTREPFPEGMAATNRIKCYANALISQHIDCAVIVYGRNNYDETLLPSGTFGNISYEYIGGSTRKFKGRWSAKIQSFILYLKLLYFLWNRLKAGDFILGYNELDFILLWLIVKMVHLKKSYYISELCELPYGTGCECKKTIRQRESAYKYLFPKYNGVIAISETLYEIAIKYCSQSAIKIKIPILVDCVDFDFPDESLSAPFPYIFHAGTLFEQKDGILGMLEAFGMTAKKLDPPIHFILTGSIKNSPHEKEINEIITKYDIQDNVHFLGYITNSELQKYLAQSTLVIINKYPTKQNLYCFSTKLGEYMAAGKPIIITRVGEAMNWLTNKDDCIIVDANNNQQLSDAIFYAFEHLELLKKIGQNAKVNGKAFFDYRNYGKSLCDMLIKIGHQNPDIYTK